MGVSGNPIGYSVHRADALDEAAQEVKASAGMFFGGVAYNSNAGVRYLHLYNSTDGSGNIVYTQPLPATSVTPFEIVGGIPCDTAMSVEITSAFDGTGAVTGEDVSLLYV